MTKQFIGTKIITAYALEKDGKPGYGVIYADGYTSWSPKDVFESTYIDIGHVAHLPAHLQRLVGEQAELDDKLAKLRAFFLSERFASLPADERSRLDQQAAAMQVYSNILAARLDAALPRAPVSTAD